MDTLQSKPIHGFTPEDLEYLVKRGVDPELAAREGLKSVDESEVHHLTKNLIVVGGGLCMAYRAPLPRPWEPGVKPYHRIQLHEREANGNRKTDCPTGPAPLYFTSTAAKPSMDPIFICESPIKALAIATAGFPCATGLGGVDAGFFVPGTQRTQMTKHLEPYFQAGRTVFIAFDAGRTTNSRVAMAEAKIARKLLDRGCKVRLVELPLADDGSDQGPDDFIARKGKQAFADLVVSARNAEPIQHAHDVRDDADRARQLRSDLPFLASIQAGGGGVLDGVARALKSFFRRKELDDAYKLHPAHRAPIPKGASNAKPWEKDLITDKNGPKAVSANYTTILENDSAWQGVLAFDELANDITFKSTPNLPQFLKRKPGDKWVDEDDVSLANWFQMEHGIVGAKVNAMRGVVALVAHRRSFCPLRSKLESLAWDGVPRVDNWLTAYCGVASTGYSRLVGRWWLISAIARAFKPGAKVDHVLVLEGEQDRGKSSAFRILGFDGEFFTDDLRNVGDAECAKQLRGKWICELSELAAVTRRDLETIKSFITRQTDNFRPSYGRTALDFPRRCVFGGSVNPVQGQGYLKDATGERRWWPVTVGIIRLDELQRDRDMLWAEAVSLYKAGERWWPMREEAVRLFQPEQEKRREVDAYEEPLRAWLAKAVRDGGHVSIESILSDGLKIPLERHGAAINRVRKIMHTLGWASKNVRGKSGQHKAWFRGESADPHDGTPDVVAHPEACGEMIN
ncbi:MAG: DUF3854 domain-containing protein [Labilithrix sp.]|nr:DUF3854 domain-containing protein [Labilithrix sp.]